MNEKEQHIHITYTRRKFTANSANIWMSDKIETLHK